MSPHTPPEREPRQAAVCYCVQTTHVLVVNHYVRVSSAAPDGPGAALAALEGHHEFAATTLCDKEARPPIIRVASTVEFVQAAFGSLVNLEAVAPFVEWMNQEEASASEPE